jgi:putative DNA methylase
MTTRKKLIEVALPLEAINIASAKEKSIRHGHPSTLHLWWARRPLAVARAVIFAQMVDDPSANPDLFPTEKAQQKERARLFKIIEDLVKWENTTNDEVLNRAREEIWQSWRRTCAENADHPRADQLFDRHVLPAFHDPFAGGGALPLEAQRLGLVSHASDLNPVAVLINKAMIEIPAKFAGRPPVNPEARKNPALIAGTWNGARGLADDVRYYAKWMRDEAEKRIGHLYPQIAVTSESASERPDLKPYVGKQLTVIAWLWARTVKSPNPAFANVDVPLASTFMLSTKSGTEAYIEPSVEGGEYRFTVKVGKPKDPAINNGTKTSRGANFRCVVSGAPISEPYVKAEGAAGRMKARLLAIVAQGERERVYLPADILHERIATQAQPTWFPDQEISYDPHSGATWVVLYGLKTFGSLFTPRQLIALTTLSDLIKDARDLASRDGICAGLSNSDNSLSGGGDGATAYADAIAVYLAFAVSKAVDRNTSLCFWERPMNRLRGTFGRQALPMVWDFAETNPFAGAGGDFYGTANSLSEVLDQFIVHVPTGNVDQADARTQSLSDTKVVSSDPPYYDNIGYADLSDFFYVWLRRSLSPVFPGLFATVVTPKDAELIVAPSRHGGKSQAEDYFLNGMTEAFHRIAEQAHPAFPVTIYYAFKQSERTADQGTVSSGWDTFLDAVIRSGFSITGTWPVRTEQLAGLKDAINALASSIVLVCRHRARDATSATRREFVASLKAELPQALANLQRGNIAPVDLAQAAIGPGMAVYTRYSAVLDAEGKPVPVRDALALINQVLDETLAAQEGDFEADSRFALAWFEQHGFDVGDFGVADVLARAKNTSVQGLVDAGIVKSSRGNVRLLKPSEMNDDWDPSTDTRLSTWESVHQLIRALELSGEASAAGLVAKLGSKAELARELCYRLYTLCEKKKRAVEALSYNGLVQSFPELERLAKEPGRKAPAQTSMLAGDEE